MPRARPSWCRRWVRCRVSAVCTPRLATALVGASRMVQHRVRPLAYLNAMASRERSMPSIPNTRKLMAYLATPAWPIRPAVDLAMLVPAGGVAEALQECGKKGIKAAISIAGGFAEAGGLPSRAPDADLRTLRHSRLVGPNCVGVLHPARGMTATFSSEPEKSHARCPAGRAGAVHPIRRPGRALLLKFRQTWTLTWLRFTVINDDGHQRTDPGLR